MAMPLVALVAALSLANAALPQACEEQRAGDSSRLDNLHSLHLATDAGGDDASAVLSLSDSARGGLWLSGDTAAGFAHLQWIAGKQPAGVLDIDPGGKVSINLKKLARAAGISGENGSLDRRRIASFVASDEGLMLLAQLTGGLARYLLQIGPTAPVLAGPIRVTGVVNYDNRYDSRVNPRRRGGQKVDSERPPEGFDALIAINPGFSLYNCDARRLVPQPQILFHELAEAHARVELGLDYLPHGVERGAHEVALDREAILQRERVGWSIISTFGCNIAVNTRELCQEVLGSLPYQGKLMAEPSESRLAVYCGKRPAQNKTR